jgi:hypothetical protein
VSLLLHMDGSNGSTTFTDSSSNALTVTANGGAQISTSQYKFGGSSGYFDGSGGCLTLPDSSAWDLPSDFTIEGWIYLTAYSNSYLGYYGAAIVSQYSLGSGNAGWELRVNGTSSAYNTINVYTGSTDLNFAASISLNQWTHIAVSRQGSSIKAFVDGTQAGSTITNSDSFTESGSRALYIGALNDSNYRFWFNGYIDDLRITKGIARYTSNFTPPTASFPGVVTSQAPIDLTAFPSIYSNTAMLLHMNGANGSTTFSDSSINNLTVARIGAAQISTDQSKFGGSSLYLNGNNSCLAASRNSAFNFNDEVFSVDMWIYPLETKRQALISQSYDAPPSGSDLYNPSADFTGWLRGWVLYLDNNMLKFSYSVKRQWPVSSYAGSLSGQYFYDTFTLGNMSGDLLQVPTNTWSYVGIARTATAVFGDPTSLNFDFYVNSNGGLRTSYHLGSDFISIGGGYTVTSLFVSADQLSSFPLYIGRYSYFSAPNTNQDFHGYIDELRIVKTFLPDFSSGPPTAPYASP